MGRFFFLSAFVLFPAAVFFVVYSLVDFLFRMYGVPLPFEKFGVIAGLGAAAWAIGAVLGCRGRSKKGRFLP